MIFKVSFRISIHSEISVDKLQAPYADRFCIRPLYLNLCAIYITSMRGEKLRTVIRTNITAFFVENNRLHHVLVKYISKAKLWFEVCDFGLLLILKTRACYCP
jgi:hypothetical protein